MFRLDNFETVTAAIFYRGSERAVDASEGSSGSIGVGLCIVSLIVYWT